MIPRNQADDSLPVRRSAALPPTPPEEEPLRPPVIALGLVAIAGLLAFGWVASERASSERGAAVNQDLSQAAPPATLSDDFEVTDGQVLGEQGLPWGLLGADFAVENGAAVSPAGEATGMALLDTSWSDITLGVRVGEVTPGSGLVFRFVDLYNHWSLVAAPEYSTWNLVLTVDGQVVQSTPVGLSTTAEGTLLTVTTSGTSVGVAVSGEPKLTITNPTFVEATGVGYLVTPGGRNSFDDFFVTANGD